MDATEAELIAAAQAGDVAARNQLLLSMLPTIRKICVTLATKYRFDLEDVTQNCAIAVLEAIHGWDPSHGASLKTYLSPRVRGQVLDYVRDQFPKGFRRPCGTVPKRLSIHALDDDDQSMLESLRDEYAAEDFMVLEAQDQLGAMADCFVWPERDLLLLRFRHGLTFKECAERLGLSETWASQTMARLQKRVRELVQLGQWDLAGGQFKRE